MESNKHRRRSIRLKGYDYSKTGAYFITICTHDRLCLFGEIIESGESGPAGIELNEVGMIICEEWVNTDQIRNEIRLGDFVIMPNHIHGIIWIVGTSDQTPASVDVGANIVGANGGIRPKNGTGVLPYAPTKQNGVSTQSDFVSPSKTIGAVVRGFKSAATRRIRDIRQNPAMVVWQRNYWEHIIRDDSDMTRIREYITNNPAQWNLDSLNITAPGGQKPYGG